MFNQSPPLAVHSAVLKLKLEPVLSIDMVCERGLLPPNCFVKLRLARSTKAAARTVTLTGTVTLPLADRNVNKPVKVPGTNPLPGKLLATTPTVTVEGATPLVAETVSQLPLSEVTASAV